MNQTESTSANPAAVLDAFHPAVRDWFAERFGAPSRAQELGWPAIAQCDSPAAHDVLLCAPTGSGKTLAAFMWAISRLVADAERGALEDRVAVLYVSPLKALANDIRLNLDEPLIGIRRAAERAGLRLAEIRAGLRTGDTPAHERSAMLRRPPHIIVTTPESLFNLLTSPRFRESLAAVRYVIVDELHAIAGNKRGAHLMVTLERLDRMVRARGGTRPARIGLSATLNPIERLGCFLAGCDNELPGASAPRAVRIVRADDRPRELDLAIIAPGPELGPIATHPHWEAMYEEVARLVGEHRTTLLFTLSRRWAERIALNLQSRLGAGAVMAHHGSLARAERLEAEQRLKRGELRAIVATSSLELGIDVGAVDLVCQIDSPRSISSAIQRIGRSGHSLGATPRGRFFALTLDDLLECAAAVRAIRRGHLDEVEVPTGCLDVAAQQIVAIAAEEDEISERELLAILRGAVNFAGLDARTLSDLLGQMAADLPNRTPGTGSRILYDRVGGRVRARRGARLAALMSGGTIPENGNYDVVIQSEGRRIGDVEEDFAQESSRGDIFALGSMPWRILGISRNRLMVEAAPGMAPSLPFWQTEAGGRSTALSREIAELREEIYRRLVSDEAAAAQWLVDECAMRADAANQAVAFVKRGVAALGAVPGDRDIVVEPFFDGLGGTQVVIHSPFGIRFNRGLGLALRKRLCQSFDFEIQASAIDDGVLLALNSRHSFALESMLAMINSRNVSPVLEQALLAAPMFEVRFRHVASRALILMRSMRGRKVPAWIQRLRAQELIASIFPGREACLENRPPEIEIPAHFTVAETMRECLSESTDLARLLEVLRGIERGEIRVHTVDNVAPSVFAHRLLLAWDYSFLDGGERANRRSRTVQMNRAMAEDVLRTEDLSEMLAEDAIATVVAEAGRRALSRQARNRDELLEIIRAHGALALSEIGDRAAGDWAAMVGDLEREGRVIRFRIDIARPLALIAIEDAPLFAAAYPSAMPESASAEPFRMNPVPLIDAGEARREIVRRALSTMGPTDSVELVERLGMARREIEGYLEALEAAGAIFRGHFTGRRAAAAGSAAMPIQWCDRYNLERIHRLTLGRIRDQIEPCSDAAYTALRMRWSHVGGVGIEAGQAGLAAVLDQLSGLAMSPEFWESALLVARLPGYRPEWLDALCQSGEFAWLALAADSEITHAPSRICFIRRGAAPAWLAGRDAAGEIADPAERAVLEALEGGGAFYLDDLADRADLPEHVALAVLWRLAAAGRVSNDSFAPLRLLASSPEAADALGASPRAIATRHDAAIRARLKSSVSGRWSAVGGRPARNRPRDSDPIRDAAVMLLARNGILSREMLAHEEIPYAWHELAFALRRMEYAGTIRRGYFVRSLSGEQYALPAAAEMLAEVRAINPQRDRPVALSAADPANPYGAMLPGCGVAREAANVVVMRGGRLMLGLAGRALVTFEAIDDDAFAAAIAALLAARRKVAVETIDGVSSLESERVGAMAVAGFHSDGRALIFDGLPGPEPARLGRRRAAAAEKIVKGA